MRINDIQQTSFKVRNFLDWQKSGKLILNPNFQRREVWSSTAKSFLIDSIDKNFPIPPILLREQTLDPKEYTTKYEVVDGQQRLHAILTYIDHNSFKDFDPQKDDFTVKPYHNVKLAGKKFSQLSEDTQQHILDYQMVCHVLPSSVEDGEILEIFSRLNSTGVKLNQQELRNASYSGEFKSSVYRLAAEQLPRWRKWKIFSEVQLTRMNEDELTSELIILILDGVVAKSQKYIDSKYKKLDAAFPSRIEVERRFLITMDEIDVKMGNRLEDSVFNRTIIFYSLFAVFYEKLFKFSSSLKSKTKPNPIAKKWVDRLWVKAKDIKDLNAPDNVILSLKGQTNTVSNRKILYEYLLR